MAISARSAQLQNQRGNALYGSSGKIRLLSPNTSSIASIAKKTANAELDIMVKNYNAGTVSNADMRAFLEKTLNNPGISDLDKADVQNQIKDFDFRIQGDKLTAAYKAAPDGSLQQLQGAQALSSYYKQRAATMQPDTPAYADNITSASAYDNKVMDIQQSMQTKARQNQRYILEQKVNQIPSGTSESSIAKANMWQELYNQANADGDVIAANQYAANYQKEITTANELGSKEQISAEKEDLRNILGQLTNDYHDGRINEQQYLDTLAQLSSRIDATNDYGLINTLNRTTDIIQKNLTKGGLKRGTTASGLPTVLGKGKGGSGAGGVVTDWDQQDFDYSDSLRKLDKGLKDGKITPEQYKVTLSNVIKQRATDLEQQVNAAEAVAAENPNAKIMYNGKKTRAADVVDSLSKEAEKLYEQSAVVINGGKIGLVQIPPKEFNKAGDVTKTGKSFATFELIDESNLPKDEYAKDEAGVYHQIIQRERPLTLEEQANVFNNTYTDQTGKIFKVRTDASTGNQYLLTGEKYVKSYKPNSSESIDAEINSEGIVPSFEAGKNMMAQDKRTEEIRKKRESEKQLLIQSRKEAPIKDQNGNPLSVIGAVQKPVNIQKAVTSGGLVEGSPVEPVKPKVVAPISAEKLNLPKNVPLNAPQVSLPQAINTGNQASGTGYKAPAIPALKVAVPAQTNIQKAVASGALPKNVKLPAPPKTSSGTAAQATKDVLNNKYSVTNSLKALANTLSFGLLKF